MSGRAQTEATTLAAGWVSVILPAYNRAGLIEETLESVRGQAYRPIELIVVDDASTDETPEVVRRWMDAVRCDTGFRTELIRQGHGGPSRARNRGLAAARGEYVQYLDSDDLLAPDKLAVHVQALRNDGECDFVYGTAYPFRMKAGEVTEPIRGTNLAVRLVDVCRGWQWTVNDPVYRRGFCERMGPWCEALERYEDWEYGVRAVLQARRFRGVPAGRSYCRGGHEPRDDQEFVRRCMEWAAGAYRAIAEDLRLAGRRDPELALILQRHAARTCHGLLSRDCPEEAMKLARWAVGLYRWGPWSTLLRLLAIDGQLSGGRLSTWLIRGSLEFRHFATQRARALAV